MPPCFPEEWESPGAILGFSASTYAQSHPTAWICMESFAVLSRAGTAAAPVTAVSEHSRALCCPRTWLTAVTGGEDKGSPIKRKWVQPSL